MIHTIARHDHVQDVNEILVIPLLYVVLNFRSKIESTIAAIVAIKNIAGKNNMYVINVFSNEVTKLQTLNVEKISDKSMFIALVILIMSFIACGHGIAIVDPKLEKTCRKPTNIRIVPAISSTKPDCDFNVFP